MSESANFGYGTILGSAALNAAINARILSSAINQPSGVLGLDAAGTASAALVTPSYPELVSVPNQTFAGLPGQAEPVSKIAGQTYNLGNFGWQGDGSASDITIATNVRKAVTAFNNNEINAIIEIPGGYWGGDPVVNYSNNYFLTRHVHWVALKPLYSGTSGHTLVQSIGDGDTFEYVDAGSRIITKVMNTSADNNGSSLAGGTGGAVMSLNYINNSPNFTSQSVLFGGLAVTYTSTTQSKGNPVGSVVSMYSYGQNGLNAQDTAFGVRTNSYGANATWSYFTDHRDLRGFTPVSYGQTGNEVDFFSNGPDAQGGRCWAFFTHNINPGRSGWQANKKVYQLGDPSDATNTTNASVIELIPTGTTQICTFVCIQSGTTGSTMPAFVFDNYPTQSTYTDGTAIWKFGTTQQAGIDKGHWWSGSGSNYFNRIAFITGNFNGSVFDMHGCNLLGDATIFKFPDGGQIDFSAPYYPNQWFPNITHAVGDRVIAHYPDGYVYICTQAGESYSSQPNWASGANGATIVDGGTRWIRDKTGNKLGHISTVDFTGSISGTTLTVTDLEDQGVPLAAGMTLDDATGAIANGTTIVSGSGTSFTVSVSQTVASESMVATLPVPALFYTTNSTGKAVNTVQALVISDLGKVSAAAGIGIGGSLGPAWQPGTGAPTYVAPKGSLYSRTDGGLSTTLYVSQGSGTWNPVSGV